MTEFQDVATYIANITSDFLGDCVGFKTCPFKTYEEALCAYNKHIDRINRRFQEETYGPKVYHKHNTMLRLYKAKHSNKAVKLLPVRRRSN